MSNKIADPTVSAIGQAVPSVHLNNGHKKIRRENQYSPTELGRRHTDDGKGMPVHLNHTADDAAVFLKMAVPICVGEDDIRSAIWAALIGGVDDPAKVRLNTQDIEVVSAHLVKPDARWILAGV